MRALKSRDVRNLHSIALADKRTTKADRIILAEIARTGQAGNAKRLAVVAGLKSPAAAEATIGKLRNLGYLPPVAS